MRDGRHGHSAHHGGKATDLIDVSEKAREVGRTLDKSGRARATIEITGLIRRTCSDLQETYPLADLPESVRVYGDKTLDTVVNEVVENAIKHNDREIPRVTISVSTIETNEGWWVKIVVIDDGPGIPGGTRGAYRGEGNRFSARKRTRTVVDELDCR